MNPEIKRKWLVALRSGEYKQCIGSLNNGHGFCCLGVLTDLYLKEHNLGWDAPLGTESLLSAKTLPIEVQEWAGLEGNLPEYDAEGDDRGLHEDNDNGYLFPEIADIIDEHF